MAKWKRRVRGGVKFFLHGYCHCYWLLFFSLKKDCWWHLFENWKGTVKEHAVGRVRE